MGTSTDTDRTNPPPVVRAAHFDDAERLGVINVDCWRHLHDGILSQRFLESLDVAEMVERWRDLLEEPPANQAFLVAEVDGIVASYARGGAYRIQKDADPDEDVSGWCEIYAIYTHPKQLGRGGGTAVHDAMIETLVGFGHTRAYLWAAEHDPHSYAWYGSRGWRPDGTTTVWMGVGEPLPEVRLMREIP